MHSTPCAALWQVVASVAVAPGTLTVHFDPPADDGGRPILSYTLSSAVTPRVGSPAAPAEASVSGSGSPLVLTGPGAHNVPVPNQTPHAIEQTDHAVGTDFGAVASKTRPPNSRN